MDSLCCVHGVFDFGELADHPLEHRDNLQDVGQDHTGDGGRDREAGGDNEDTGCKDHCVFSVSFFWKQWEKGTRQESIHKFPIKSNLMLSHL